MKFYLSLAALFCWTLVDSAPLREHELTRAAESAMTLAKKILSGIPAAHAACVINTGLTLSSEDKSLEYLLSEIGIPAPPVLKSEDLTLEMRLTRITNGLELHLKLLQEISDALSSSDGLKMLIADVTDLSAQTHTMQRLAHIPSTESQEGFPQLSLRLDGEYKVQVAAHLSLQQLRSFTQDVFRSLRHIAASN